MILGKRQFLQSEIATLEELISQTPEEDVIDRKSLEARKRKVAAELSALQLPYYEPAHGQLIFRGKPTIKSQGVYADFAASALDRYANMITVLGSSQIAELGSRGPLPKSEGFQLMITGTVLGSFGFEIEEVPKQTAIVSELSPVKAAMEKANLIMELSSRPSDEDIADVIADTNARVIEAIRAFLDVMEKYEAIFAIELDDNNPLRFDNVEQIKQVKERLKPENIIEDDVDLLGRFQGTLPTPRRFEFLRLEPREIIVGKIGPEIEDPSNINVLIGKTMKIRVHTKQVGTSRPRYTLNNYEGIIQ